jgi:DNA-binding NtrC family response regulator
MRRLLIIDNSSEPVASSLLRALNPDSAIQYDQERWDSFVPERLKSDAADMVIPVAISEHLNAIRFFDWLRRHPIRMPTLAVLPSNPNTRLLDSTSEVTDDFILWPVGEHEFRSRVQRILGPSDHDVESTISRLSHQMGMEQLVGAAATFIPIARKIELVARTDAPVLITGETGTGKELCARTIHTSSKRRNFPFIPVDCAAMPDHLFENEIFGHVRGAFTDARTDQKGLAAMAEGGTLFLDEVDALSIGGQAKLLRFLQEKTYKPLGSCRFEHANVTVIAASNKNLEMSITSQQFRSDLFFRLNVIHLQLPALRERAGDIPLLARHFLARLIESEACPAKVLSAAALRKLRGYEWPGNVRELFNVIHRAAIFSEGTQISSSDIPVPEITESSGGNFRQARQTAIQLFERSYIEELLRKHNGNVTRASREAQQDRRAFGRLMKKYRISRDLFTVG